MQPCNQQYDIVDLYATDDGDANPNCQPFQQYISFEGPQGEIVCIKALFDEGAMVSAMCTSTFNRIKHRLHNWGSSMKRLRMVNGTIVPSRAVWKGEVSIKGIKTQGEFEVFDSGGGWKFLFGKPLLHAFRAIHEYETDTIHISGKGGTTMIHNQGQDMKATVEEANDNEAAGSTTIPIRVITDNEPLPDNEMGTLFNSIPTNFLGDEAAIFTRVADPRNPKCIAYILKAVQYRKSLNPEERE